MSGQEIINLIPIRQETFDKIIAAGYRPVKIDILQKGDKYWNWHSSTVETSTGAKCSYAFVVLEKLPPRKVWREVTVEQALSMISKGPIPVRVSRNNTCWVEAKLCAVDMSKNDKLPFWIGGGWYAQCQVEFTEE